jgi:LSD1 subclass zinc finger protein
MSDDTASSDLTETINCPHCGAMATYRRGAASVRCEYCGQSIPIPGATPLVQVSDGEAEGRPQGTSTPVGRGLAVGIGLVVLFVIGMLAVTIGLPLASEPQFVPELTRPPRPTLTAARSPTPAPTATPAFGSVDLTFGHEGMGPGTFTRATSIGVDGSGNVYVGERQGGRVQVFNAAGKFVTQWFVGNAKTILYSLAAAQDGSVYVAFDGGISRFEGATGKLLGQIQYAGGKGFETISLAPDGGLAALHYADTPGDLTSREGVHDDLVLFDAQGQVTHVISSVVSDQTDGPERELRLAVDGQRNIYVLSRYSNAVFKFSPQGKFLQRFGGHGNKPGQFEFVSAIAVDGEGRVYVSDSERVSVFGPSGRYLDSFAVGGGAFSMVFDNSDQLWMADSDHVSKAVLRER